MQAAAPVDILAQLLSPAHAGAGKAVAGKVPSSLFHGDLLAYAASSAVVVVDAQKLSVAITLSGAHRSAAVSALAWHPGGGARDPRSISHLRLASGDEEGRVMVWNVQTGSVIAALDDPLVSAFGAGVRRPEGGRSAVAGLAWVTSSPSVLAILLSPAVLVLWDYKTGSILWRKDFGSSEAFTGVAVDPLDRRRLVLCGSKGTFIVLRLVNPVADRVNQKQYQVELGTGGTLRCIFSRTHDLLFLLLQREVIAFDLEYGQPAASTALPSSRPPFEDILASFGHASAGKSLQAGGIDLLYCSHRDGSLSIWQRSARLLTYSMVGSVKLLPPPLKLHTGPAPTLVALAADLWRGLQPQGSDSAGSSAPLSALAFRDAGRRHPGTVRRQVSTEPPNGSSAGGDRSMHVLSNSGTPSSPTAGGSSGPLADSSQHSVLLMGVATDGKVWQWQLPLLAGARAEAKAPLPSMPTPRVLGLLHTLSQRATSFSVCPVPVALPGSGQVVAAMAAGTASGSIELVPVQQGSLTPLHTSISVCLSVHKTAVLGMRWLGAGPRLVSYSTEKTPNGYNNTLLLTDMCTRVSLPFRDVPNDAAPVSGMRASPSGRYLLVIFRGIPSEIWLMSGPTGGGRPRRLRQVDLQFTAVEWLVPNSMPLEQRQAAAAGVEAGLPAGWQVSPPPAPGTPEVYDPGSPSRHSSDQSGGGGADDAPEERLAFALIDGRVGVLAVRGRRIQDTRPRRPSWTPLASGDFRVTALSSWAQFVFLGDAEGNLARWDTVTGRCLVVETGHGRVHRIAAAPPPCELLHHNAAAVQARVAVLFASGAFAVYDMDQASELRSSHVTPHAAAARVGRTADMEWLPLPVPIGGGSVLAAALEDGSLVLLDTVHNLEVRPRRMRMLRYRAALAAAPAAAAAGGKSGPRLAPPPPLAVPLLLPRAWGLLLRLLLQRGLRESVFRDLATLTASTATTPGSGSSSACRSQEAERALERLEADLWACLPRGSQAAWEAMLRSSEAAEAAGLAQILDNFADTEDDDHDSGGASASSSAAALQQAGAPQGGAMGSPVSSSRDAEAAAALGLAGRMPSSSSSKRLLGADVAHKVKSMGGAFKDRVKDVAHASRSHLNRLPLGLGDRGSSNAALRQLGMLPPLSGVSDSAEAPQGGQGVGYQSLVGVLQAAGALRCTPAVLTQAELAAYSVALSTHRVADRMVLAAQLGGDEEEARFWRCLPATLRWVSNQMDQARSGRRSSSGAGGIVLGTSSGSAPGAAPAGDGSAWMPLSVLTEAGALLWSDLLERLEAGERSAWHEQMSRRVFENSEELQEKRVLEYVALGDFQTAVGFLLASPPDRSTRYYRDALCTLGMAFACGLQATALGSSSGGANTSTLAAADENASSNNEARSTPQESAARTLFVQAAKVITANAASVGDTLLGVPLLCSTGQHADAANLLQDAGLWYYASALTAHSLRGPERAAALERWASHMAWTEGRLWAATGVLVAAGALRSALQLLRQAGLPDAAQALVAACLEAEVPVQQHNMASGQLQNLFAGDQPAVQRYNSAGERLSDQAQPAGRAGPAEGEASAPRRGISDAEANETAREFQEYVVEVLNQL